LKYKSCRESIFCNR